MVRPQRISDRLVNRHDQRKTALARLREWSAARLSTDPDEWSSEQWPADVRRRADAFADRLRAHALAPPVVHCVEWGDLWSMGDLFPRWLTPPGGSRPLTVFADRFEIYGYALPDDGRLAEHLATAGPDPWDESDWYASRLAEVVGAWRVVVDRAAVVVLREVMGGLVTDEEVDKFLDYLPDWLSDL